VINSNFGLISPIIFEILTFKARKWLVFPTRPCLTPPLGGNPLEFRDETYSAKARGMELPYGKINLIILTSTVFGWFIRVPDRQTVGR